jgi:hypothetical protein
MRLFKGDNPGGRDVFIDQLLTNISIGYKNPKMIADSIFPTVNVKAQSGKVLQFDQSAWFRDEALIRAAATRSRGGGFNVSTQSYFTDRYSWRYEIDDEQRALVGSTYNLEASATDFVNGKLWLKRERGLSNAIFKTGVWGTDVVGGTDFVQWNDLAASSPLRDIATWQELVEAKIGVEPRDLVLGRKVWTWLKWHPDLVDTIKYTQVGKVTSDTLITLADLDRIHVGGALYVTSAAGVAEASATYGRIWGPHALLMYVPQRPAIMEPAAGYTYVWDRVQGALQYIKRMRNEEREVDIIEGNTYFQHVITAPRAGLFAQNVVPA